MAIALVGPYRRAEFASNRLMLRTSQQTQASRARQAPSVRPTEVGRRRSVQGLARQRQKWGYNVKDDPVRFDTILVSERSLQQVAPTT